LWASPTRSVYFKLTNIFVSFILNSPTRSILFFYFRPYMGIVRPPLTVRFFHFSTLGVVLAEPETMTVEMTADDAFIILASDGLWAHCTSAEAVEHVYRSLEEAKYRMAGGGATVEWHLLVQNACAELQKEVKKRAEEKSQPSDDVGIVVLTLSAFWEARQCKQQVAPNSTLGTATVEGAVGQA
jgi:serine/threonine protein phosphatase PrpC